MSKTASCRNGYCESGFADKRIHADTVDFWHVAISDDGVPDRLLANAADGRRKGLRNGSP